MSAPAVSVDEWIVGTLEHPPKENLSYFASRVLCLLRIWEWRKELVQVIWEMAPEPLWAPDCAIEGYALVLIQVLRGCLCLVEFSAPCTCFIIHHSYLSSQLEDEGRFHSCVFHHLCSQYLTQFLALSEFSVDVCWLNEFILNCWFFPPPSNVLTSITAASTTTWN